jgi:hypothetical protein
MPFRAIWVDNDPSGETGASMGADCLKGVNSEYISNKIKITGFKDRAYIYNLASLYKSIVNGVSCWASSHAYHMLAARYPEEHLALLKENSPEGYRRELERRRLRSAEARRYKEEERNKVGQQKRVWVAAGGK